VRRRHRQAAAVGGTGTRTGRFERVMFSFMGPPELGDVHAPPTSAPDPQAALCHRCAEPWDEHEVVRTSSHTYLNCPPGAAR
jgi:hypothetical protein